MCSGDLTVTDVDVCNVLINDVLIVNERFYEQKVSPIEELDV